MAAGYLDRVRFLIVDDNSFSRQIIRLILMQFGARDIAEAADGTAAQKETRAFKPDIILLDWVMSPMDGVEFVRWLRESEDSPDPFAPVIMVTSYSHLSNIMQARDLGVNEFLAKPISAKSLFMRIKAVIEKPRTFVRADPYFGPDRRRRLLPHRGEDRRDSMDLQFEDDTTE